MRYRVLATDYDNTLAHESVVASKAIEALQRLRHSGRAIILVTGRIAGDARQWCNCLELFDLVVAENGATLLDPKTGEETDLGPKPPPEFVEELDRRGVVPLDVGRVIVATSEPHEQTVLQVIREQGLDMHVIFNRGAVMVLPSGVDKGSGLRAALARLGFSPHDVAGIGDAENDRAFLQICGFSAAVANALPAIKEGADVVTRGSDGAGVAELAEILLKDS